MATYTTSWTTISTNDAATGWGEMVAPNGSGGAPALDNENYIQGTGSLSQPTAQATDQSAGVNLDLSQVAVGTLTSTGWTTGDVVFVWLDFAAPANIYDWDASDTGATGAGGWVCGFQDNRQNNNSRWDAWRCLGSDFGTYPYGGWQCAVFYPLGTADQSGAGGSAAGAWNYFISVPNLRNAITKGSPHVVDAIRFGRGFIEITGTGGSFSELAAYNDYDDAANTPPGTSSTSVDSGRHKLGIFSERGGGYVWQGLLQFGASGSTITFSDSNAIITKLDTPRTYAGFDKIEIINASSSVTWNTVTINGAETTVETTFTNFPRSWGNFEMVDNATLILRGCTFVDLGTFILQSNATVDQGTTFRRCQVVTQGGASLDDVNFVNTQVSTESIISTTATIANITNCSFTRAAGTINAVFIDNITTTGTLTWDGNTLTGYGTQTVGTGITSTSGGALRLRFTSGTPTITISVVNSGTIPTVEIVNAGGTGTVNIEQNVEFALTVTDVDGTAIVGAQVGVFNADTNATITNQLTTTGGVLTTQVFTAANQNLVIRVRKSTTGSTRYIPLETTASLGTANLSLSATLTVDELVEL